MPTSHKKIKIWKTVKDPQVLISKEVEELILLAQESAGREEIIGKLRRIVPEYQPDRL